MLPALAPGMGLAPKLNMASVPAASSAMPMLKMDVSSSSSCEKTDTRVQFGCTDLHQGWQQHENPQSLAQY